MANVTIRALADDNVLTFGDGYRTKRSEHGAPGYRILRVADVADGRVDLDGPDFVSKAFTGAIGGKLSQPGDVLLTTKGTVGRVAIYPEGVEQAVYSPQLCFFRVLRKDVLDARFLSFWFKSEAFRHQASHRANNTDMAAYINLRDIASLAIELPAMKEQQAMVEVLGALDDKVAANAKLVGVADQLASVRFESMLGNTAKPLSSLAKFVNGKAFTKDASGTGRVVIRIAELNSGIGSSTVYNDIEVADDHLARSGDLLFAWSGSLTVQRWFRPEGIVNQHIFKVIPTDVPMWVVKGALDRKLREFRAVAADKATTMGHIQRRHLDDAVPVPTDEAIGRHDAAMAALWDRALAAEEESLKLVAVRDVLLQELMSGRLSVKDAGRAVEGAV